MSTCEANSTFCSAAVFTVVVWLGLLLLLSNSASFAVAEAELVIDPGAVDLAVIVTVAVAFGAIEPRLAVTVPVDPTGGVTSEPCEVVAETNVILAGRVSVRAVPVALNGVLIFFTVSV